MEYKFKEGQDEKIPANEAVIEKRGHVISFSLREMEADLLSFEKTLKELKANRDLKQGIVDNMNQHHPFIKDMSDFDRYAVHMYQENWALVKAYNEKIEAITKEFDEYKEEIIEVKKQLPVLADIVSPMQEVGGEVKEVVEETKEVEEKIVEPTNEEETTKTE